MDVQEIDGATNNSVDDVRELRESARYKPARDRYKIWIIDEVHMLSSGAFNALLKTLEEPPPQVKFIFATTEYHKLPETILSRCQQYDFRMIPTLKLFEHLRKVATAEVITVSDKALEAIARAAEGSARDALSLFDQVLSFSPSGHDVRDEDLPALLGLVDRELLLGASTAVAAGDTLALLELVEKLSEYGADYRTFARELLLHLREVLVLKLAPDESRLLVSLVPEERERLRPLADAFSEEDLVRFFDVLTEAGRRLADKATPDPRITFELALLKMAQMRRLVPFAELVARVEALVAGAAATTGRPRGVEACGTRRAGRPVARTAAERLQAALATVRRRLGSAAVPAGARARDRAAEPPASTRRARAPAAVTEAPPRDDLLGCRCSPHAGPASLSHPASQGGDARAGRQRMRAPRLARLPDPRRSLTPTSTASSPRRRWVAPPSSTSWRRPRRRRRPPPRSRSRRTASAKQAEADPAVREAMGLFDGRLVDVRPPRA